MKCASEPSAVSVSRRTFLIRGLLLIPLMLALTPYPLSAQAPNIIVIYADDLGYGDVGCYGATEVATPNIDRIAREGCRFTDGHSAAATCTPSRYALMTGEYAWRRPGTGIAAGDANAIIEPGRVTVASTLRKAGFRSAVVGKWHLGLGSGPIDWNQPIMPGPLEIGFDESFIIPATGDRVPCVYVANHNVVGLNAKDPISVSFSEPVGDGPTGLSNPDLLKLQWDHGHDATIVNGVSRIGFMSGGKSARWVDEDMADVLTRQAVLFIDRHKATHRDQPFFLFFNPHNIHVPRLPNARFSGRTSLGPRGDAIVELDWAVGEILNALDQHQARDNTLLIFTSDNGPVLNDGYQDLAEEKNGTHAPTGRFRGGKYSAFEGGTRVPLIVRWPARIHGGTSSDALVSQIDFLASFAALTGEVLPQGAAPDSINTVSAFMGVDRAGRSHLVQQARGLALRRGTWKLIEPNMGPAIEPNMGPAITQNTRIETGNAPEYQLYDLSSDPGEQRNVADQNPAQVTEMKTLLDRIRKDGTPR